MGKSIIIQFSLLIVFINSNYSIDGNALVSPDVCLEQINKAEPIYLCARDIGAPIICNNRLVGVVRRLLFPENQLQCTEGLAPHMLIVTGVCEQIEWMQFYVGKAESDAVSLNYVTNTSLLLISNFFNLYFMFHILSN